MCFIEKDELKLTQVELLSFFIFKSVLKLDCKKIQCKSEKQCDLSCFEREMEAIFAQKSV